MSEFQLGSAPLEVPKAPVAPVPATPASAPTLSIVPNPAPAPVAPPAPPALQVVPAPAPERKRRVAPRPVPQLANRIIAVGGGKGGIGKSLVSANLGIELAKRGKRVVLIDADLGGANLHTCLGVDPPKVTLSNFIERKVSKLHEIVVPVGVPNLGLVSGAMDSLDIANPRHGQKMKLLRNLRSLPCDYVILDLGAGTGFNTIDFFLTADHGILVLVPEPTSVENGYRFVKAAFFRRLAAVRAELGIDSVVGQAMTRWQEGVLRTPLDVLAEVNKHDPEAGQKLAREMTWFRPRLVVNQARSEAEREVGNAVVAAWRKYFGLEMDFLGAIGYDDEVWKAVRRRRPVLLENPASVTAQSMTKIADNLLNIDATLVPSQVR